MQCRQFFDASNPARQTQTAAENPETMDLSSAKNDDIYADQSQPISGDAELSLAQTSICIEQRPYQFPRSTMKCNTGCG